MQRSAFALALALSLLASLCAAQSVSYLKDRSFNLPGKESPDAVQDPVGLGVSPGGSIYVLDGKGKIDVFSSTGEFQHAITSPSIVRPIGMAVSPAGDLIVLNGQSRQVVILNPSGELKCSFGGSGDNPGELSAPLALAVGPQGQIYVLDADRKAIELFTGDGLFLRQLLPPATLAKPVALAVGPDGAIYVADRATPGSFYKLPASEQVPWSGPYPVNQVSRITIQGGASPNLVAMAANIKGTVLLLDGDVGKVWRHRQDATPDANRNDCIYGGLGESIGSFLKPVALAFAAADEVVILDSQQRKVERIRLSGEADLKSVESAPPSLCVGFGNPASFPGTVVALDCDSSGVNSFFLSPNGKTVVQRKAERTLYLTTCGDTAAAFAVAGQSEETAYGQDLSSVGGVAVQDSVVAVTDPERDRVVILHNRTAALIGTFGDKYRDERRFNNPLGVAFAPGGRVVIADNGSNMLRTLSSDLANVTGIPFAKPAGVAADPAGNIYVWSVDGARLSRLRAEGGLEAVTGSAFPARPGALAFDRGGNTFVFDAESQQILILDRDAKTVLLTFGPAERYQAPSGLFVDPAGNIYLADRKANVTHVFHWSVAIPPPGNLAVTYHRSGATVSWPQSSSKYLWGYEVYARTSAGKAVRLARQRGNSLELALPDSGGMIPQSVWVVPISISGGSGSAATPVPLPGLSAMAAMRGGDPAAAADQAEATRQQLAGGSEVKADTAVVNAIQLARFFGACARHDREVILDAGPPLKGIVPAANRPFYHRCLTEAYLGAGKRDLATQELLAVAGEKPARSLLGDTSLVNLCFRIFEAGMTAGDTTGALGNLRTFVESFTDSAAWKDTLFAERMVASEARVKFARGLALWNEHDYAGTLKYFDRVLSIGTVPLVAQERILIFQIQAATHFAMGKLDEAKSKFLTIFEVKRGFDLQHAAARIPRDYGFQLYTPEMIGFFGGLHPAIKQ